MTGDVRPLALRDLPVVAELHATQLPVGFFPQLGTRFLAGYHATFLDGPHAEAFVAEVDGKVVGFVVGSTDAEAHARWTAAERGPQLALSGALSLLTRPAALQTFLTTRLGRYSRAVVRRLRPRRVPEGVLSTEGATPRQGPAVLVHVAVDADARGHRLGARLVECFAETCRRSGAPEVRLVTDADSRAVQFYTHLGWERLADRPAADGRPVAEFRLAFSTGSGERGGQPVVHRDE